MKMGKKVREYKSGDFIFAKVKGYPAWPARVQRLNGKKYFVYFYGTGETANLPPNMIFDYAENKEKFLTKTVKRRDFNDGVKQIEYDFANNVPLEQVIGVATEPTEDTANDTMNDTGNDADETADTTADDTLADESTTANTTQNETGIEDSDETSGLIIDEAKAKGKKATAKTPAKETPKAQAKTPRGKGKKEDSEEKEKDEKKEEELVSRSGRKIRPKRYMDEHTEENTTLPSPAPKKRRGTSPTTDKDKEVTKDKTEKIIKHFNAVPQSELEDLKEPFTPDEPEKENILIAYLPSGQYVGIKLFQSRPNSFKNDAAKLQWDKQAATNAITLKNQLERGHITAQSVITQLNMDLSLTDEEKTMLDKERETEEKKSRVQFLKTEMKLIKLDAKIKTCLCLEKAETELCLKLLDELMELDIKPLMLLKHPSCLESIKRMRAYVGNTVSWELSESAALAFGKHAHRIRKLADAIYTRVQQLFNTPEGLSFWEYFSERVAYFKKVTSKLSSDELLELVHEPIELSQPTPQTMKSAVESANELEATFEAQKKKPQAVGRPKRNATANATPTKTPVKRQNSKKQVKEDTEEDTDKTENEKDKDEDTQNAESEKDTDTEKESTINKDSTEESAEKTQETEEKEKETEGDTDDAQKENDTEMETDNQESNEKNTEDSESKETEDDSAKADTVEKQKDSDKDEKKEKEKDKNGADKAKDSKGVKNSNKDKSKEDEKAKDTKDKAADKKEKAEKRKLSTDNGKDSKSKEESPNEEEKSSKSEKEKDSAKEEETPEPRAKRTRESKKTEQPPPRSPTKRKSKV